VIRRRHGARVQPWQRALALQTASRASFPSVSQKIQESAFSLLTLRRPPDYIRLTNDSGSAAADEEVRF
jgi:hypothetical protein